MELIGFIQSKVNLSKQAIEEVDRAFKTEQLGKNVTLVRPDSFSQRVYFVEKGLVRMYYYRMDKDITQFFFKENTFTASLNYIFYNLPDDYGWEAVEASTIRSAAYRDLSPLMDKYPALQKFFFLVAIDMLNQFSLKLESLQFQTAEDRYKAMIEAYPDILLRAPLGHIASYLGITQQTLSVIRGRK